MMEKEDLINFGGTDVPDSGLDAARVVILPLPYEQGPSYGTGSAGGPRHILEASAQLERMDEETLLDWGALGFHTLPPPVLSEDPETAVQRMKTAAKKVLAAGKFLLSLGGDHAVSIGPIMAAAEIFPDIGVLQIDAHADLRTVWNGSRFNHACVMRRVVEDMGLPAVGVGIRSVSGEEVEFIRERNLNVFYAQDIGIEESTWIGQVVDALPAHVYLTIDLDGFDPSVIPGTGTPEPGGLTYRQVVGLIRHLGRERKVVAADITELTKIPGTQVSEFTAAKLATKIFICCTDFPRDTP